MTSFMECSDPFFLVGNDTALLLCSDPHFYKGFLNIILCNVRTVFFCSDDRRLIQKIFQISSSKSGCCLCDLF